MPMSRYQIRNEYSLSDPELYCSAEKDDPEALLEGVSMAGLVGVLRQLGDLAEFAAEIFRDLHEEVMLTAARGHGLMIRVQELEAELPSIERAFLFQTDHSSFFYNPGVDWHPNFRENKNLVAYGDMPRFIMSSYEECRGPPQLFLLDKYDIGGAGACLKRYTDPAFFKVETAMRSSADCPPNNKVRKAKKRGAGVNNDDAAAALMRSNPKLHQLFLEEPIGKSVNKPARVKLKRRLSGFPFDTKSGRSYMENLFVSPIEDEILHGVARSSPLWLPAAGHNESNPDILEVRPVSPVRKTIQRIGHQHQDEPGTIQNQFIHGKSDVPTDKICQEHSSYSSISGITTTVDEEGSETDIHVDGERKQGSSFLRMRRDIASEIDGHPEAPSAMDLEMKADCDLGLKNDLTSSFFKRQLSVANQEHFYSQPSDFHATTSLLMSEEENNAIISGRSSLTSPYMQRTLVRDSLTEEKDEASLIIVDKGCSVDQVLEPSVSPDNYLKSVMLNKDRHDVALLNSVLQNTDPLYSLPCSDSEEVSSEAQLKVYLSNETASALQYSEKESGLILNSAASPRTRSCDMQLQVNSSMFSPVECIPNESKSVNSPSTSMLSQENSVSVTSHSIPEDNYGQEVLKPMKSSILSSNTSDVLHPKMLNSEEIVLSSKMVSGEYTDDIQDCPVSAPCNYTKRDCNGDTTPLMVCTRKNLDNDSDPEVFDAVYDSWKAPMESYRTHFEIVGTQNHCSNSSHDKQIDLENLAISANGTLGSAPDTCDFQETHVTGSNFLESPLFSGGDKSQSNGETNDILTNNSVELDKSVSTFCNFFDATEMPMMENDRVEKSRDAPGLEMNQVSGPEDMETLNDVPLLEVTDSKTCQQICSSAPKISGCSTGESIILPVGPQEFVEEPVSRLADAGLDGLDVYSHPDMKCGESGYNASEKSKASSRYDSDNSFTERVDEDSAGTKDTSGFFCSEINFSNLESEKSLDILGSGLVPMVDNSSDHLDTTCSPAPQQHLDKGQDPFLKSDHQIELSSANPLRDNMETVIQERNKSPPYEGSLVSSPLHEENQVALNETPPLPPLPPFKWRMGKFPCSATSRGELANVEKPLSAEISMVVPSLVEDMNFANSYFHDASMMEAEPRSSVEVSRIIHTTFHHPSEIAKIEQVSQTAEGELGNQKKFFSQEISIPDASNAASKHSNRQTSSIADVSPIHASYFTTANESEEQQHSSVAVREEIYHEELLPAETSVHVASIDAGSFIETTSSPATQCVSGVKFKEENPEQSSSIETNLNKELHSPEVSTPASSSDVDLVNCSAAQFLSETKSKEEKAEPRSSSVEADSIHVHPHPEMESRKLKLPYPVSDENESAFEEGVVNEFPKGKLARPHKPLIDDVSALDKSKLRKVVQRDRGQAVKVNERDTLLEQIRAKSFNLKPAMGSRPRVEAPRTNLRVAAILEKANAIRQALAGSDEDEEENWSDS